MQLRPVDDISSTVRRIVGCLWLELKADLLAGWRSESVTDCLDA